VNLDRRPRKSPATNRRHLVWIERRTLTRDGEGGYTEAWARVGGSQIWASVSPIKAVQRLDYQSVEVDATHLLTFGGYDDVEENDRVSFGTRTFEILTIENIQERDFLKVCTCKEMRP